jgi:diguanylate cyclase (GGDEF)-like protein/PAS domain S-box-containing protein
MKSSDTSAKSPATGWWRRGVETLRLDSLIGRYLLVTVILVLILVSAAWFASTRVGSAARGNALNQFERQSVSHKIRDMGDHLWIAETTLQAYLLAPGPEQREGGRQMLTRLVEDARIFSLEPSVRNIPSLREATESLHQDLDRLAGEVKRVMEIRVNPEQLFPAMPTMLTYMLPAANEFQNAASRGLDESREARDKSEQVQVYDHFTEARYTWTQLIGAFRLWVANRFAVFGEVENSMRAQASNIELYAEQVDYHLKALAALERQGQLGVFQSEALAVMRASLTTWLKHYRQVHKIYTSEHWRTDVPLLRDSIHPLFMRAWKGLRTLQQEIEAYSGQDIESTTQVADEVSRTLWLFVLIIFLVVAAGSAVFELQIRRPLARLARALKDEAAGATDVTLPTTQTTETRNLVEAFRHMQYEVHTRQERLQAILDNTAEGVITFDERGLIESWNQAAERLFGWSEDEILGTSIAGLISPESRENRGDYVNHFLRFEIQRLVGHEGEVTGRHKNGSTFPLSLKISRMQLEGKNKFTAMLANISERKAMMENLRQLAEHDGLTGLYNRSYFLAEFERLVERLRRDDQRTCALFYIDLDNFKYVNDTLGHAAGDRLLMEVSNLLRRRARKSDLVARLGGDEFIVLAYDIKPELVGKVAESFRRTLADYTFRHDGRDVTIGCSIGVALVNSKTLSPAQAMSQADLGCHLAKRAGRNGVHLFREADAQDMQTMTLDMGWSHRIKEAIENDRFVLACQPVVCTRTRVAKSHEILLRLRDEHGELIMPSGFLPTAERFGLAAEIDQWVIRHAITLLAEQRRQDPARRFAINLSAQSLTSPAVAEVITQTLAATGLEPAALIFEVTETAAIADMNTAVAFLAQLRALGCQTALDDFGSGLSSFAYLREMPVDLVKIDGRFVKQLLRSPVDQAMVKAMNDIAHALGKETIAEFVESEEHFQLLKKLGVDYGQGYHLGKPEITEPDPASARSRRARA